MARIPAEESKRVQIAVIGAAVEEIAAHGFAGLRIPRVAKRIGKTQGAVYGRFPDKESLALAAVEYIRDRVMWPRVADTLGTDDSPITKLSELGAMTAQIAQENPAGTRMLMRLASELADEDSELAGAVRDLFLSFTLAVGRLLEEASSRGILPKELGKHADLEDLAMATVGMQLGLASMSTLFPEQTTYGRMDKVLRKVLDRGIRSI